MTLICQACPEYHPRILNTEDTLIRDFNTGNDAEVKPLMFYIGSATVIGHDGDHKLQHHAR